ncbi:magnesium/nickel/cobalt transporter CorA [Yersinia pestis 24H]|nr:magnesium/nickel/cobalt transporter CorA [Yersinia pestis 24H]
MPSFDIVSEIDMQEVRNAVENATRDLANRWDFRNVPASFELNEKTKVSKSSANLIFR